MAAISTALLEQYEVPFKFTDFMCPVVVLFPDATSNISTMYTVGKQ